MIHRFFISVPSWKSAPGAATVVPELVQGAITSLNAEIVSTHETATHIIAQHIRQPDIQQALKSNPSTKLCGLLWLFASIEANQILDPSASPLYQPFPSQAAEQHSDEESASSYSPKVSCTGYVGVSRLMVSALCQSIGLQFEGQLYLTGASATDVLIAIDVDGDSPKISGAREHDIPVVNLNWILIILSTWKIQPVDAFEKSEPVNIVFHMPAQQRLLSSGVVDDSQDVYGYKPSTRDDVAENFHGDNAGTIAGQEMDAHVHQGNRHHNPSCHAPEQEQKGILKVRQGQKDNTAHDGSRKREPAMMKTKRDSNPAVAAFVTTTTNAIAVDAPCIETKEKKSTTTGSTKKEADTTATANNLKRKEVSAKASGLASSKKKQRKESSPKSKSPHFAFSGLRSAQQRALHQKLASLGIACSMGTHDWSDKFTHVIAPDMKRNQKCLAALAAGVWIVEPGYVDACMKAGKLVDEKAYEVKKGAEGHTESITERNVASYWRKHREKTGHGAFYGRTFAVARTLDGLPTSHDIISIIKAGGGTVVTANESAELMIVSQTRVQSTRKQLRDDQKKMVLVSPLYVVDVLTKPRAKIDVKNFKV